MKTNKLTMLPALIILSVAVIFFLAACNSFGKKGNGKVTISEREISPFTKISIEGIFPVEISQDSGKEFVKVETDENLQSLITVKNEGDLLIVEMKEKTSIRHSTKMKVYVNIKDLRELEFKSVGNLNTLGSLKLDSLKLNSQSVGKLELNINANYLHADLESVGATTLTGVVNEVRINNKSVGTLSAFDLKAGTLMIHNEAVGSTEIYADSAFYIRSSAVGVLYYKGPGEVKELKSEGIGKVQKKD
jgi:hypothetical protein